MPVQIAKSLYSIALHTHYVINDSDGDDKFYRRRIRENMLYLNDPSEAVRIALIDFGWWRP